MLSLGQADRTATSNSYPDSAYDSWLAVRRRAIKEPLPLPEPEPQYEPELEVVDKQDERSVV